MIAIKILKKDFQRKKLISLVTFAFILLSTALVASGSNLILDLTSSVNALFEKSKAPHFVQMHAGELDQSEIDLWAATNGLVQDQQTVEMITVDGSALFIGDAQTPEENSIMDISFVRQNTSFDFLLDLNNEIIQLSPGEVAVPIYYMQRDNLQLGDSLEIHEGSYRNSFTLAAFSRDAQMNPSIVHSKRFMVHQDDYEALKQAFPDKEYLIEFRLTEPGRVNEFTRDYQAAGLPQKGPAVDHILFKTLNSLSDGIVAGVVIVLSILLMIIAILCLRFTILATIEEDSDEIGVMKAIGIAQRDIRRIYLAKYVVFGLMAALLGYLLSIALGGVFSSNLFLYFGPASENLIHQAVPLVAASAISMIVIVSCWIVLRRLHKLTAVEALRTGTIGESVRLFPILELHNRRWHRVNLFLGLRDVIQRSKLFRLLSFVFFFAVFVAIVPVNFLTTIQSPSFISYMGIGQSDIRIDLRHSEDVAGRFDRMIDQLSSDPDVAQYSPMVTSQYTMIGADGSEESINIETGDFTIFPLDYVAGEAPTRPNHIALSTLNAQEMEKEVGDTIHLIVQGQEREMIVSGIYQDVTNGGRTAKARLAADPDSALWYSVSVDLVDGGQIEEKVSQYSEEFFPARVTDLEGYAAQTLGNTIDQLTGVTIVAVFVGLSIAALITSLFLRMLVSKDASQIAIMRSLGFSLQDIRAQYLSRALLVLGVGIVVGTIFANTLGQQLVSVLWAFMGASQIKFVIKPWLAYLVLPSLLILAVSIAALSSMKDIRETNISQIIME